MRWIRATLVALAVLAVLAGVLVWTAPAPLAWRLYAGQLAPLRAQALSGSAWDGRAGQLSVFAVPLGALEWRLERWPTLRGRPRGSFVLRGERIEGEAGFAGGDGVLELRGLRARFPAQLLGPALDIPAFTFLGRVELDVPRARIVDGLLQEAEGVAVWRELGVTGLAEARMEGLEMRFAPSGDGALLATLRDLGGPLAVDGTLVLRDGRFLTETYLALREPSPALEEALKYVGERLPDGRTYLRIEGELTPLSQDP